MVFTVAIEKDQVICFGLADADPGREPGLIWRWDGNGVDMIPAPTGGVRQDRTRHKS